MKCSKMTCSECGKWCEDEGILCNSCLNESIKDIMSQANPCTFTSPLHVPKPLTLGDLNKAISSIKSDFKVTAMVGYGTESKITTLRDNIDKEWSW